MRSQAPKDPDQGSTPPTSPPSPREPRARNPEEGAVTGATPQAPGSRPRRPHGHGQNILNVGKRVPHTQLYLRRPHSPQARDTRGASSTLLTGDRDEVWYKDLESAVVEVWALPVVSPFLRCEIWGFGELGSFLGSWGFGDGGSPSPSPQKKIPKKLPKLLPKLDG